jgi:hypothetical protein
MRFFWQAKPHMTPHAFFMSLVTVVSIVLIWRGIWYVMDRVDLLFFGGDHMVTAVAGSLLGLALLYWPDRDLKEITSH